MDKRKQEGFLDPDVFKGMMIAMCLVAALGGWAIIEGALWITSHITIGWAS